jgi:hypothetical protein
VRLRVVNPFANNLPRAVDDAHTGQCFSQANVGMARVKDTDNAPCKTLEIERKKQQSC